MAERRRATRGVNESDGHGLPPCMDGKAPRRWRGRSAERRVRSQSRVADPLRRVRLSTLHRGDFCPRDRDFLGRDGPLVADPSAAAFTAARLSQSSH